jgi:hypothetical protein
MKSLTALFAMSPRVWARHANPLSGWTRLPILPLLTAVIYFRAELGWLYLPALFAVILWTWVNPRAFPPPLSTQNWMSKAVLGERVWLNRTAVPIPAHHARAARRLSWLALPGLLILAWGLTVYAPWPTVLGCCLAILPKLWFLDRMVWLFEDMKDQHPEYQSWEQHAE